MSGASRSQAHAAGAALPDRAAVGIVGVGNMGGGMAQRLLGLGWSVHVCDCNTERAHFLEQKGAFRHNSPALCATKSEALIVCVVDDVQTEDVLFGPQGVVQGLAAGRAVLLCPTLAPAVVEDFARRLQQAGFAVIDAPMSGGPQRAADGSMSLMLAAAPGVLAQHQTLLQALSARRFVISERVGDGARTKLVNNLLAGIQLVGAAEVLALATRMGLDAERTLDVIGQSSGQSWIGEDRMRRAIAGDLAPRAHMTLLAKDTRLAVAAAQQAGWVGPLGPVAAEQFARAVAAGLAELDDAAMLRWLQQAQDS